MTYRILWTAEDVDGGWWTEVPDLAGVWEHAARAAVMRDGQPPVQLVSVEEVEES